MDSEGRQSQGGRASPELVRANPRVDVGKLREAEQAVRELRQRGVGPPTPMVRSPFDKQPTSRKRGAAPL